MGLTRWKLRVDRSEPLARGDNVHSHQFLAALEYDFHLPGGYNFGNYANPEAGMQQQSAFSVVVRDLVRRDTLPAGIEQQLSPVVVGFWPVDPFIEDRWKQVFVVFAFFEQQIVLADEIDPVGLLELKAGIVFKVIDIPVAVHSFCGMFQFPILCCCRFQSRSLEL